MFPNTALSEKRKVVPVLFCLFIIAAAFLAFYLDIVTRNLIAFDVFYFPFIMAITWYLGGRPGFLITTLILFLWLAAQGYEGYAANIPDFIVDGILHTVIFFLIFWLTHLVRQRALLLSERTKELARSNEELERFASKAAHDLQAPLANVFGFTELLQVKYKDSQDEQTNGYIEHILKGIRRMSDFIRALLDYAKVMKPEGMTTSVDLNEILKGVLESLQLVIAQKKAQVSFDALPQVRINPDLVGLLLQNLITNAMKYCEKEPRIHIRAEKKGKEWLFSVKDNGIGIPEKSRERIFIMFEKLETKRQYPGSGIGLATCQKIVERYGGRIWVESALGEGSTFYFTLPVA